MRLHCTAPQWPGAAAERYLLLAAVPVLLGLLCFAQQVGEGQRLERPGAWRPGVPEGVAVTGVTPTAHRAERARAHAARRMDAVDADHGGSVCAGVLGKVHWGRHTGASSRCSSRRKRRSEGSSAPPGEEKTSDDGWRENKF